MDAVLCCLDSIELARELSLVQKVDLLSRQVLRILGVQRAYLQGYSRLLLV